MSDRDYEVVVKILEETQNEEIDWEENNYEFKSMNAHWIIAGKSYHAHYKERTIRIYHYKFKNYIDDERFVWESDYQLEVIDSIGNSKYSFPKFSILEELYKAIQFLSEEIGDFFDEVLK